MNDKKILIEVKDICKTYFMGGSSVRAVCNINLRFYHGELTSIMGSSGSGKSTLMHILGCLDRPTSGQYLLEGEDVSNFSKNQLAHVRNKKIGFVFQGFNLLSRTSALENVELPMIYGAVPEKERRERAMQALESVGLKGRENHYPNQLSGGQQQRVAIARAIANNPSVILADEPSGNLDTYSSMEILGLFQALNRQGISIILITHEPEISLCTSRVIRLSDGVIKSDEVIKNVVQASEEIKKIPRPDSMEVKET